MMDSTAIMTILTHPLQVLLIGVMLSRLVREGVAQARQARRSGTAAHNRRWQRQVREAGRPA